MVLYTVADSFHRLSHFGFVRFALSSCCRCAYISVLLEMGHSGHTYSLPSCLFLGFQASRSNQQREITHKYGRECQQAKKLSPILAHTCIFKHVLSQPFSLSQLFSHSLSLPSIFTSYFSSFSLCIFIFILASSYFYSKLQNGGERAKSSTDMTLFSIFCSFSLSRYSPFCFSCFSPIPFSFFPSLSTIPVSRIHNGRLRC